MKLDELDLSSAFGNYGAAALKGGWDSMRGKATGNLSTKDRMAKDGFIKDFVGRASANIQSAIEGGLVSAATPTATQPTAPAKPVPPPAAGVAASSTGGQTTASATGVKHAANPNNPNQPKPAVAPVAATATPAVPAHTGGRVPGQLSQTPNAIRKRDATVAKRAPAAAAPAPAAARAGAKSRAMTQQRRFNKGSAIQENYDRLSQIFESIMEAGEQTAPGISSYLQKMFIQYMHGVDTSSASAKVKELCDAVEKSYTKDGGKAALTQLANLGFALSYSNKGKDAIAAPTGTSTGMGSSFMQGLTGQTSATDTTSTTTPVAATGTTPPTFEQIAAQVKNMNIEDKKKLIAILQAPSQADLDADNARMATGTNEDIQVKSYKKWGTK